MGTESIPESRQPTPCQYYKLSSLGRGVIAPVNGLTGSKFSGERLRNFSGSKMTFRNSGGIAEDNIDDI